MLHRDSVHDKVKSVSASLIPLKILHISEYDYHAFTGGVPRYVKELSELQAEYGHDVCVFSCYNGSGHSRYITVNNVKIRRFRYFEFLRVPVSLEMCIAFLRMKEKPDIVHIHHTYPIVGEIITILSKLRRIPVVTTVHNEPVLLNNSILNRIAYMLWRNILAKISFGLADAIIVTTRDFAETSDIFRSMTNKLYEIPIGIDLYRIDTNYSMEIGVIEGSRDRDRSYLLYVGRLVPEKGLHVLIDALKIVKSSSIKSSSIMLYVVGPWERDDEVEYKRELDRMIEAYNLHENITFLGRISDDELHRMYGGARALIVPSLTRRDNFGIVQLEAMAHGVPVIVSDLPGLRVVAGDAAIVVRTGSAQELAEAILRIMDDRVREEMSRKALERIRRYDWHAIYRNIEELYRRMCR